MEGGYSELALFQQLGTESKEKIAMKRVKKLLWKDQIYLVIQYMFNAQSKTIIKKKE